MVSQSNETNPLSAAERSASIGGKPSIFTAIVASDQQQGCWEAGHRRTLPFLADVAKFLRVNKLTAGSKDREDVVGYSPVKLKLLQFTGSGI